MVNAPKGATQVEDGQLNAAFLQMEGLPTSPKLFEELMAWRGFTLTGIDDQEADESQELRESKTA
ncbi:MAG: transposase, partial [Candidatus Korarchaeum sp.]